MNYNVGDVANGHVWTGTAWVPVNHVPLNGESESPNAIGAVVNGQRWDGTRWVPLVLETGDASADSEPWYRSPIGVVGIVAGGLLGIAVLVAGVAASDGAVAGAGSGGVEDGSVAAAAPADLTPETPDSAAPGAELPGDSVRVDEWTVKVADVNPNASAEIEDANQFNDDPDYQYVMVTLKGKNGADEAKDLQSFNVKLQGGDKVIYKDESWLMVMPKDLATEAAPGGTVKAQFVFDAPQAALSEGVVILVDGVPVAPS